MAGFSWCIGTSAPIGVSKSYQVSEKAIVAVDLGAQSCRVSLLRWRGNRPEIRVVHRFSNGPVTLRTGLHWDIKRILAGVETGLHLCAEAAPEGIASVGVDGWAVDYVRYDRGGNPLGDPFCYRDERTANAMKEVRQLIPAERLYTLTGIQLLSLNTLFQLYADKIAGIDPGAGWLNIPEYVTFRLGGRPVAEYTNATHTQLVALGRNQWCSEIFQTAGIDLSAAPELVGTGTFVGSISGELGRKPAFRETRLIVPACHDTASAIAAIPAAGDDWAFISSGTWSLVGTVLGRPGVGEDARKMNFTNLGGVGGTVCFLKNVNGMWLLQQCMDEWTKIGQVWSLADLLSACEKLPPPDELVDVDDPQLMLPGNLPCKINLLLAETGHAPLPPNRSGIPQMANVIFHSLARRYAEVLTAVSKVTGKQLKRLFVVGGGGRNEFLNRLTAERTGLEVRRGSSEASTIGNLAIQIAALREDRAVGAAVSAAEATRCAESLSSLSFAASVE
jgi:rhamnulokinase